MEAVGELGLDYRNRGEFDQSLEYLDKAIRASPNDLTLAYWYGSKAWDNFGLKNYDLARYDEARDWWSVRPLDPEDDVKFWRDLGDCEARLHGALWIVLVRFG